MQTAFFADGLRAQRGELLGDLLLLLARALAVQLNLPVLQHLLPVEVRLLLAEPLDVLQHALALRVRLGIEGALLLGQPRHDVLLPPPLPHQPIGVLLLELVEPGGEFRGKVRAFLRASAANLRLAEALDLRLDLLAGALVALALVLRHALVHRARRQR